MIEQIGKIVEHSEAKPPVDVKMDFWEGVERKADGNIKESWDRIFDAAEGQLAGNSDSLLNAAQKDVLFGEKPVSISDAYDPGIVKNLNDIVEGPNKDIKDLWGKYKNGIRVEDPGYAGDEAYYDPETGAVTLNMEACRVGSFFEPPYQTVFHEFGHNIDQRINETINGDDDRLMSEVYKNGLLGKTAKEETAQFIENYRLGMESGEGRLISYNEACDKISDELINKIPLMERSDLSDIFEGASDGAICLGVGHGQDYWKRNDNGIEIFAEMFSASICNKGSLNVVKEYFPETYKVFKEIVGVANGQTA